MFIVYILYSKALDVYYIGSTSNMEDRLKRHLSNHKGFTRRAKDWVVIYKEEFCDKKLALVREKEIKNWKSRIQVEQLISSADSAHSD